MPMCPITHLATIHMHDLSVSLSNNLKYLFFTISILNELFLLHMPLVSLHTYTQRFYGSMDFVRDNTGELVPEETFTHWSQ